MEGIPKNSEVRSIIEKLHEWIIARPRTGGGSSVHKRIREQNRLFRLLCANPSLDAGDYAEELVKRYGYDIRGGRVFFCFRDHSMRGADRREMLCQWAGKVADQFALCLRTRRRDDV